jgi:hypothetical protein
LGEPMALFLSLSWKQMMKVGVLMAKYFGVT